MLVGGKEMRSLWYEDECLKLIDQRKLPAKLEIFEAKNVENVAYAIKEMVVRGAPAIGCAAAYGVAMADDVEKAAELLKSTRPTAHDLFYAVDYMLEKIEYGEDALKAADEYVEGIIEKCRKIGENGKKLISKNARILTHCNAGALATVDYGTALAPIRMAKDKNIFVWVDETRPRLQGLLTAWELEQEGVEHAIIADNAAGYFMKNGSVDLVIVGADRIAANYDVANKIGTYEKAVVAKENDIPFYVAAPLSTFDESIEDGGKIKIEERNEEEVTSIYPWKPKKARNPAFDVTPAKYITAIITEESIIEVNK
ncbi:MAG TPA: S-methyl-5-thioribose-1-phosphate isomerase [Thermoplasmatales archaeon]|nr:S-methyl-5-thioribose-1-phosphate isomerase [Thermoplasmatales archaeon]